jgi:hypothetical protein
MWESVQAKVSLARAAGRTQASLPWGPGPVEVWEGKEDMTQILSPGARVAGDGTQSFSLTKEALCH